MFVNWCSLMIWRYVHVLFAVLEWKAWTFGARARVTHCYINDNRTHTTCMPGITWLSPYADWFTILGVCADRNCVAEYAGWSRMFVHAWSADDCGDTERDNAVEYRVRAWYKQASQHGCYDGNGYRSLVQLKTPLIWYVFSYATNETNTHRSSLRTRHSSLTICILLTMVGRAERTTVCMLEQFHKAKHVIVMGRHEIAHNIQY